MFKKYSFIISYICKKVKNYWFSNLTYWLHLKKIYTCILYFVISYCMYGVKRIYEIPSQDDGYRILIDRLWPRGISKEHAKIDLWLKEIAPSTDLRKWFHHETQKWQIFQEKYVQELQSKIPLVLQIQEFEKNYQKITLLYGAKDEFHNQAIILKEFLESHTKGL